ncbi:hypothetical protein [Microbacterium marinilacus]|uniref:Asp23/Gls24 family envelope stress response protein n=2 Tax=Microbacterium marinilacus TaxID=415209 RepID=A0ABP7BLA4_9MICO|nr:hypothetical protein [Microbacterium marinilacus]
MSQEQLLATAVETAIRSVPGVAGVFRAGTTVSKLVDVGARLVGAKDEAAPLVRIEESADGGRVDAAIGVQASAGAVDTVHRVHAAVDAALVQHGVVPAEIRVTVVHVDGIASPGPLSPGIPASLREDGQEHAPSW